MQDWFHKCILCYDGAQSWDEISLKGQHYFQICDGDQLLHWKHRGFHIILDIIMVIHFIERINSLIIALHCRRITQRKKIKPP